MLRFDNLEGQFVKNRYEIKNIIGSGGAGKVYLAQDTEEGRLVAIKAANPNATMSSFKERFNMEAKILSKCDHENIIKYYDNFEIEGIKMIVIEYVEGISLEDRLRKEGTISIEEAMRYTKQLLSALGEVHRHKSYHRDIKPSNIHITTDGNLKLLDFGIVQESIDQDLTQQGSVIGTISYMAPELLRDNSRKSDERTDIYSVGVMIYQSLTGVKPFKSSDDMSLSQNQKNVYLATKIVRETAIEPHEVESSISKELSHFIMKLIQKDPSDRYQSVGDAISDLEKIERGASLNELQGYYEEETSAFATKKHIVILASFIGVLLVAIIITIVLLLIL